MIEQAQQRVVEAGYANVRLVCSPAEEAVIDGPPADAALFHFTHDILRRADALDHLLPRLRRGASVVATGLCWAPPWALPVNLFVWGAAALSVTSFNGLGAPWSMLASRLDDLQFRRLVLGGVYVIHGRAR